MLVLESALLSILGTTHTILRTLLSILGTILSILGTIHVGVICLDIQ